MFALGNRITLGLTALVGGAFPWCRAHIPASWDSYFEYVPTIGVAALGGAYVVAAILEAGLGFWGEFPRTTAPDSDGRSEGHLLDRHAAG